MFKQIRIGIDNKPFHIYKFRTMMNSSNRWNSLITVNQDPRITRSGRVLRKCKLDEIPQFLNVLKGEMSIIGPRPEVPKFIQYYSNEEKEILLMKPGITDLASIYFYDESRYLPQIEAVDEFYQKEILHTKLKLNLWYIEHSSFWIDLKILWMTFLASIGNEKIGEWLRQLIKNKFVNPDAEKQI